MANFNIICPNCKTLLQVEDNLSGKTIKCPLCHKESIVPRRSCGAVSAPGVQPPPPPPPPPPPLPPPPSVPRNMSSPQMNGNDPSADKSDGCILFGCLPIVLYIGGVGFYILAVVDFCGMFFKYDITGSRYTPILFGFLGQVCFYIANLFTRNNR